MSEGDRSRSETLAANERIKSLSAIFFNLVAALIAAAVTRSYVSQDIDRTALLVGRRDYDYMGRMEAAIPASGGGKLMTLSPQVAEMVPGLAAIALSIVGFIGIKIVEFRRARARKHTPHP